MGEPLEGYVPHSWSTYIVNITDGMLLPTRPLTNGLVTIDAESASAVALANGDEYDVTTMFFFDFEQLNAGHNVYGCGPLCELDAEYEGHAEGKLCFVSYEGMENDPPNYNFFVQN